MERLAQQDLDLGVARARLGGGQPRSRPMRAMFFA